LADHDLIMPPKYYIEPKFRSGIVIWALD
jgi:uncharacterized protein (DUF1015 family)